MGLIIGVDPSITCSGISDGVNTDLVKTDVGPKDIHPWADIKRRVDYIVSEYAAFIGRSLVAHGETDYSIYIEAPMTNGPQANHLMEMGALFKRLADTFGADRLFLIPPSTLKKHLTGHGDAPKKHKDCQAVRKGGKSLRPLCVVCAASELHNVQFDKDPGLDKLHSWGAWSFGTAVAAGELDFIPPHRRGQGKKQIAKRARTKRVSISDRANSPQRNSPDSKRRGVRVAASK